MALYGTRVEYALHTMVNLTLAPDETAPSGRDLAEFQRLPVPFVRKLLTSLEHAGLVVGSEGVRGGWRLARNPREITTLEVAEAANGHQPLFECHEIRGRCILWPDASPPRAASTGTCSIHAVMLAAEASMRRELASHTLADIVDKVTAKSSQAGSAAIPAWFAERYGDRGSSPSMRAAEPVREEEEGS